MGSLIAGILVRQRTKYCAPHRKAHRTDTPWPATRRARTWAPRRKSRQGIGGSIIPAPRQFAGNSR